jgi:hypothetical protein
MGLVDDAASLVGGQEVLRAVDGVRRPPDGRLAEGRERLDGDHVVHVGEGDHRPHLAVLDRGRDAAAGMPGDGAAVRPDRGRRHLLQPAVAAVDQDTEVVGPDGVRRQVELPLDAVLQGDGHRDRARRDLVGNLEVGDLVLGDRADLGRWGPGRRLGTGDRGRRDDHAAGAQQQTGRDSSVTHVNTPRPRTRPLLEHRGPCVNDPFGSVIAPVPLDPTRSCADHPAMGRSRLAILLVVLVAFQAASRGLAVCLDGGCCHPETAPSHLEDPHDDGHDHSVLVTSGEPHHCDCTDAVVSGIDATRLGRDDRMPDDPAPPAPLFARSTGVVPLAPPAGYTPPGHPPPDDAARHRRAIVRTTRLLL